MEKLAIIIPTYCEADNIRILIPRLGSVLSKYNYEIIIVDDNSPDDTAKIAKSFAQKYPVKVLQRNDKLGLGSAILYGFMNSNAEILGVMDADLQHPPEKIVELIEAVKSGYDIAIGSRYVKGSKVKRWPFIRKLISKIAVLLAKPLIKVNDPISGFFVLRRKVIKNVRLHTKGYKLLLEILVKGNYKNIKEIPYTFINRLTGESKLKLSEIFDYLVLLGRLYAYKITSIIDKKVLCKLKFSKYAYENSNI